MVTIGGISLLQQETNGHRYILMIVAEDDALVHITNDTVFFSNTTKQIPFIVIDKTE